MRRTRWGSSARPAARLVRPVVPSVLSVALLICTPGLAQADPAADNLAALIANVAKANQRLQNLSAEIQTEQESVNKALVDVETARDNAAAAQHDLEASQQAVKDANAAIAGAQRRFDTFAAAAYMNGPSNSYLTARNPDDIIATEAAAKTLTASSQTVMAKLQQARTEQVNRESAARLAKQNADKAAADAKASQDAAVAALTNSRQKFDEQREQMIRLATERDQAQAKLEAAKRQLSTPGSGDRWETGSAGAPAPSAGRQWDGAWDPTLPMIPSANVPGDPIAVINQVLGISATSTQVTAGLGRNFLQQLGILKPDDTGITNAAPGGVGARIPRVYGRQATEYVIRRGMSQIGVPYSWGRRQRGRPQQGHRLRRQHRRLRLFGAGAVFVRRSGHQAAALLGLAVQPGPQDPVLADAPRRRHLLRPGRLPARHHLPRRRPDARGARYRVEGPRRPRPHQRHDALRGPLHRVVSK